MSDVSSHSPLNRTPLFDRHVAIGARMVPFGGWEMPLTYKGQLAEHAAVRDKVGIFDVSHMGEVRFTGQKVTEYLQWLVPANVAVLEPTQSKYTQLCNERGGVLDDLIVSRLGDNEFFAVVNASTREKDVRWMTEKAARFPGVRVSDESQQWAMIAVQGPAALGLLDRMLPGLPASVLKGFTLTPFVHSGQPHLFSRTGYTGEAGAEILCPPALAEQWWNCLLEAGCEPCGLAARDSLRLEAGYCLYGNDLDEETTPIEAGLAWSVSFKKSEDYIGRPVLEAQKKDGAKKKLVGLRAQGRRPLRHGEIVVRDGAHVGVVASGGFSPVLECGIALAYVQSQHAAAPDLAVATRGKDTPVTIVKPPFVKTSLHP